MIQVSLPMHDPDLVKNLTVFFFSAAAAVKSAAVSSDNFDHILASFDLNSSSSSTGCAGSFLMLIGTKEVPFLFLGPSKMMTNAIQQFFKGRRNSSRKVWLSHI